MCTNSQTREDKNFYPYLHHGSYYIFVKEPLAPIPARSALSSGAVSFGCHPYPRAERFCLWVASEASFSLSLRSGASLSLAAKITL